MSLFETHSPEDEEYVGRQLAKHVHYTGSEAAQRVLNHWHQLIKRFIKVMPVDYKRALAEMAKAHLPTSVLEETKPEAVVNV